MRWLSFSLPVFSTLYCYHAGSARENTSTLIWLLLMTLRYWNSTAQVMDFRLMVCLADSTEAHVVSDPLLTCLLSEQQLHLRDCK